MRAAHQGASLAIALALVLGGCRGPSTSSRKPVLPQGDPEDAARQAQALLREAYGALRRGSPDGLHGLFADQTFLVGPRATDVFLRKGDAILELAAAPARRRRVTSRGVALGGAPTGRSAWVADRLDIDGVPHRVTALLAENEDGFWVVVAMHLGHALTDDRVSELVDAGEIPAPSPLPGGVDRNAEPIAKLFRTGLARPKRFMGQLEDPPDAVVFLGGPRDGGRTASATRRHWEAQLADRPPFDLRGELRAFLTPDGGLGWVAAVADLPMEDGTSVPHRLSAIYVRRGAEFLLVALHGSVAQAAGDGRRRPHR